MYNKIQQMLTYTVSDMDELERHLCKTLFLNETADKQQRIAKVETFDRIAVYMDYIRKYDIQDYRYGTSWLETWDIKRRIRRLNTLLQEYNVEVVFV